ncbi:MAG: type I restriction-modification system subunit M N-terminal domain-containing protein [Steroidobacteraceae bacterium]
MKSTIPEVRTYMPKQTKKADTTANLGFEAKLWAAADALRNNMDAAEYKHVVLGLIFLKYISDAFEAKHAELEAQQAEGADPEDRDEYRAASIFWVPKEARWSHLKASAPQPTIGTLVDDAMAAIERDDPSLKGVLPKDYARPGLDKQRLGQIINLVSNIALGSAADRLDVRKAFNRLMRAVLLRIPAPYFENRSLAALRDALLPKLICELRIRDAEKFIGGAA